MLVVKGTQLFLSRQILRKTNPLRRKAKVCENSMKISHVALVRRFATLQLL